MSNITREQLVKILDENLAPFKQTIADLKKSVDEVVKFMEFASKQYDDMLKKVAACEVENKKLRTENVVLRKTLESVESSLKSVQKSYNDLEQYGRRECIEIRGIPQPPADHPSDESTNDIAKKVGNLIGVKIEDRDISISHRIPIKKSRVSKFKKHRPAAIIVKFTRRDKKDEFYRARTKLKNVTTRDLGFPSKNNIFISESLTAENRKLFNEALQVKKEQNYKYIWTSNGRIFLRENMDTPIIEISCSTDLHGL